MTKPPFRHAEFFKIRVIDEQTGTPIRDQIGVKELKIGECFLNLEVATGINSKVFKVVSPAVQNEHGFWEIEVDTL